MTDTYQQLAIEELHAAKDNIRHKVGNVDELAESIKAVGVAQPLVVLKNEKGMEVLAGHRRLAAAKKAGLTEVPVIVKDALNDEERAEFMLIENVQREDLTPIEEAEGYQRLVDAGWAQRKIAQRVGRPQGHISKRIALLALPKSVQAKVDSGGIYLEEAAELLRLKDHPARIEALVKEAGNSDIRKWDVDRALERIKRDQLIEMNTADLKAKGVTVLQMGGESYSRTLPKGTTKVSTSGNTWDPYVKMAPSRHAKLECHAATIDPRTGEIIALCRDTKKHPKEFQKGHSSSSSRSGQLSTAEKNRRKKKTAHNRAIKEAAEVRHDFIRSRFFGKSTPASLKDSAIVLLFIAWTNHDQAISFTVRGNWADDLLGFTGQIGGGMYGGKRQERWAKAFDKQPLRTALAIGIGACEDNLTGRTPNFRIVKQYFDFLKKHGYEISPAEQLELSGKAPR